jgi:peptidyl-prolyl cis-trans isomerase C
MIRKIQLSCFICIFFGLVACSEGINAPTTTNVPTTLSTPVDRKPTETPTVTPFTPSATPEEAAAIVNGEIITREEYLAELARFRAASETGIGSFEEDAVIDSLIDQVLLAQAATHAGFSVDDALLQTRIQNLGISDQDLENWILENGYTRASFERTLARSIAAAWMRDQIAEETSSTTEQVHARQILLYNLTDAEEVFTQLESGTDFGTLAEQYNSLTKGDLGWFPRGYLNVSELDEIVFSLEPGGYTPIIETPLGYHIVQLLERDPNHPLTPDAYRFMQTLTLRNWLEDQRSQSEIIINLP